MLNIDISQTLGKTLTPSYGIPNQELLAQRVSMKRIVSDWKKEREKGLHAWAQDPHNDDIIDRVKDIAKRVKKENIQTVVWIGIGGSGLGPKVIQEAFETPQTVEFVIIDTIDPSSLALYLEMIDWRSALVVVVSKSGGTLESMSAFFLFWNELKRVKGSKAGTRVIGITDPKNGYLHDFCVEHDIEILPIPPDVGGRYSIFSPVGLLPLALLERDVAKFCKGAIEMEELCTKETLDDNPAAILAAVQYLLEHKKGYLLRVIMPYSNRLQSIARWDQQLIAESLGKNEVHNPFPVAAIGTQDQHSLLQQWMQGPRKSWHLFIREIEKPRVYVPTGLDPEWKYINGKTFGQLLDAAYEGTARGLTAAKRPHVTISLTRIDEYHMGQLFFCLLMEVVLLGKLYRVDPYGQPGVELGKTIAKDILTRGRG